jgi:hypothetical protein
MSSALMTVVGVGASKPPDVIRVDETVTDSTAADCACATLGAHIIIKTAVLLDSASLRFTDPGLFPLESMKSPLIATIGRFARLMTKMIA